LITFRNQTWFWLWTG